MSKKHLLSVAVVALSAMLFSTSGLASQGTITPVNTAALARYKANIIKRDDALQAFNVGFYDSDTRPESVKRSLTATMAEEQRQAILHELQKQNALLEMIANELTAKRK